MPKICGINKKSLWKAWKDIRKRLSQISMRDVTDYVEFDIDPDWWIGRLLEDVETGRYEPALVYRFTLAKSLGFSRQMTFPHIPDLVLYRAVTDHLYKRAERLEQPHVYFARNTLAKKQKKIHDTAMEESEYTFSSGSAFVKWQEFYQYRKHLLLEEIHPYIVLTDISNYFDSILYDHVTAAIHEIDVSPNIVGLLFFLLERLSVREEFNESPRIGLPVDEFDCSRTLAHMVLFPHDRRMTELVNEEAYVRWMDDQTFGVCSFAHGLRILQRCSRSLSRLHLTPNTSKSKILSLEQARRHFHFDVNSNLDEIEGMPKKTPTDRMLIREKIGNVWRCSRQFEQEGGEWGKVLKRFYLLAGIGGARFLRHRAIPDILREPTLAARVIDYMRVTGDARQYTDFVSRLWNHEEQVYPDINRSLVEGFLRLEASGKDALKCRDFASDLLAKRYEVPGWGACAVIAPLLILRFGNRRSLSRLRQIIERLSDSQHPAIGKAVAVVYASHGMQEYREVIKAASALRNNYLSEFLRMLDGVVQYKQVPERFKIRRDPVYDAVAGRHRIDMRKLLAIKLLSLNSRKSVKRWVSDARQYMLNKDISPFDKALVRKLLP